MISLRYLLNVWLLLKSVGDYYDKVHMASVALPVISGKACVNFAALLCDFLFAFSPCPVPHLF